MLLLAAQWALSGVGHVISVVLDPAKAQLAAVVVTLVLNGISGFSPLKSELGRFGAVCYASYGFWLTEALFLIEAQHYHRCPAEWWSTAPCTGRASRLPSRWPCSPRSMQATPPPRYPNPRFAVLQALALCGAYCVECGLMKLTFARVCVRACVRHSACVCALRGRLLTACVTSCALSASSQPPRSSSFYPAVHATRNTYRGRLQLSHSSSLLWCSVAKPEGGPHIVIGTPGRIADMVRRRLLDLSQVRLFAADETDRLLEEPREYLRTVQRYRSHITNNTSFSDILLYQYISKYIYIYCVDIYISKYLHKCIYAGCSHTTAGSCGSRERGCRSSWCPSRGR